MIRGSGDAPRIYKCVTVVHRVDTIWKEKRTMYWMKKCIEKTINDAFQLFHFFTFIFSDSIQHHSNCKPTVSLWMQFQNNINVNVILNSVESMSMQFWTVLNQCQCNFEQCWINVNAILNSVESMSMQFWTVLNQCQCNFEQCWINVNVILNSVESMSMQFWTVLNQCQCNFEQCWINVNVISNRAVSK